ncbi:hypothetical protein IFM89_011411 [Coptis chinensis]|uniref:Uncharacterized protein n=1 Tax=Coptis chinensis TaxID=261450 RepID=A0A835HLU3_9MAGN|nr:hypothetical protein IFM89_011411 [Coptis chinensis]
MEESVRYCMEYMPKARKGSHKRGKFTTNKKGTRYILSNLQYEQVRKWLLQHCPQNAEWEAKYQLYVEPYTSHPSRGRRRKRNVATEKPLEYVPWLRQQLQNQKMTTLKRLAMGPSFEAKSGTIHPLVPNMAFVGYLDSVSNLHLAEL